MTGDAPLTHTSTTKIQSFKHNLYISGQYPGRQRCSTDLQQALL